MLPGLCIKRFAFPQVSAPGILLPSSACSKRLVVQMVRFRVNFCMSPAIFFPFPAFFCFFCAWYLNRTCGGCYLWRNPEFKAFSPLVCAVTALSLRKLVVANDELISPGPMGDFLPALCHIGNLCQWRARFGKVRSLCLLTRPLA